MNMIPDSPLFDQSKFSTFHLKINGESKRCYVSNGTYSHTDINLQEIEWRNGCRPHIYGGWRSFFGPFELLKLHDLATIDPNIQGEALYFFECGIVEIAEFGRPGTAAYYSGSGGHLSEWKRVQRYLNIILAIAPFELTYLSEASIHALFTSKIEERQVVKVANLIEEIAPYSSTSISGADRPSFNIMRDFIVAHNGFNMWWPN